MNRRGKHVLVRNYPSPSWLRVLGNFGGIDPLAGALSDLVGELNYRK